jgi:aspartyl-tRNA synthetase
MQPKRNGIRWTVERHYEYFEYGCPPHGGFAIGTERVLMKMLNYGSILETTYLPNTQQTREATFKDKAKIIYYF